MPLRVYLEAAVADVNLFERQGAPLAHSNTCIESPLYGLEDRMEDGVCRAVIHATTTEGTTYHLGRAQRTSPCTLQAPPPWPMISDHVHHVHQLSTSLPSLSATPRLRFTLVHPGRHPWTGLPWQSSMYGQHCPPGASLGADRHSRRPCVPHIYDSGSTHFGGSGSTASKMERRKDLLVLQTLDVGAIMGLGRCHHRADIRVSWSTLRSMYPPWGPIDPYFCVGPFMQIFQLEYFALIVVYL